MIDRKHKINIFYDEKMNQEFEVADHYINRKTKEVVWFVPPKVDGLYFIQAKNLFKKAESKRSEVEKSKKELESGIIMYEDKSAVYNVPIYWTTVLGEYGRMKMYETSNAKTKSFHRFSRPAG